ncbi:Flp pilus assembly protein CpaB [Guyparkeria hydrothermalis]|uniref:Flp pilus assembly protein CpaB n=1 Tax=Guyparkeria hydrothermalis TaxID=923 RepID=UPI00201FD0A3|nr:Flp pilus assembly protein CpaB [Guyparkeria hydrothermalis]MCL7743704.1 Flp pilus assembly protein CpaB [Guyparkeria hydrothermalis]
MPSNTLRLLAALLIFAGIGVALVGYLKATAPEPVNVSRSESAATEAQTHRVVVASRDIEANAVIRAADIAVTDRLIRRDGASPQYVSSPAEVLGKRAAAGIAEGQGFTPDLLSAPPAVTPLAAMVSPGHKALAVEVNEVEAAGGYLAPGDKVDLVWFVDRQGAAGPSARVVARGVRVLAVGEIIGPEADGSPAPPRETAVFAERTELVDGIREMRSAAKSESKRQPRVRSVVLELVDNDVARVLLAARSGKIRLAVHSAASARGESHGGPASADSKASVESLNGLLGVSVAEASRAVERPEPSPPKRVRVFNGSESTTVEVD